MPTLTSSTTIKMPWARQRSSSPLRRAGGRHDEAAVRLDRLDEDGCDLLRPQLALEAPVEVVEGALDQLGRELRAVGVGIDQPRETRACRRVGLGAVARNRH